METLLVFLPRSLSTVEYEDKLVGVFSEKNRTSSDSFYILALRNGTPSVRFEDVGCFNSVVKPAKITQRNYIYVSCRNRQLVVEKIIKNFKEYPLSRCHIVQYDETSFVKSELYIPKRLLNDDYKDEGDYFKLLAIHSKKLASPETDCSKPLPSILAKMLSIFHWLSYLLNVTRLSEFSSICLHVRDFTVNLPWFLERVWRDRGVSLQTGNLLFSLIVDILGGLAIAYYLGGTARYNKAHVFEVMAARTEELLECIKYLIKWLMGSPAGLKLNYPLNYILGNFFLYNIYLWWTFLGLIRPVLEVGFNAFLKLGYLGIALQIALLADVFSLVTFHLYCIYIYAARLYEFQIKGIISLSKIFLGRKRNPEPDKVDSCPYSTEQLFVGTVCFTVLLFLLPTTLVYYVVFTLIRLGFIFFGGILTRARYLLQILPLYSSIVWVVYPKLIITTMKLVPVAGPSDAGIVTLIAQPEVSSWLDTMKLCVPSILQKPKSVNWKAIVGCVLSGKLVYPV